MPSKQLPLGIKNPLMQALLSGKIHLNDTTSPALRRYLSKLAIRAKQAEVTQDAVSAVHLYTLWKSDQTVAAAHALKEMRASTASDDDMTALEDVLRRRYLEAMCQIAARGIDRIIDQSDF